MKKWIALTLLLSACSQNFNSHTANDDINTGAVVGGTLVSDSDPVSRQVLSFKIFKAPEDADGEEDTQGYQILQCTASAVAPRIILTAAHCIHTNPGSFSSAKGIHAVASIIHPEYDKNISGTPDLALVLLDADLPGDIQILQLPEKRDSLNLKTVKVAGFGRLSGKESAVGGMGVLRRTELPVIGYLRSAPVFEVDQTQGKGICQGDSGGPAMIEKNGKTLAVGVVSKTVYFHDDGIEDDSCNYRGVYVNIQYFADWISETIKSLSKKTDDHVNLIE